MKKIGTAACVFLLVSAAPASAQQWSRTTTGIVTLSAGVGLIFAAFDFTFDVCPEGYSYAHLPEPANAMPLRQPQSSV